MDLVQQPTNVLLALDQASITSGYAIFIDKKLSDWGKFTFNDDQVGDRLVKIRNQIEKLINKYNITEVAMEDIQLQDNVSNNVKTFKVLSEVFGVIVEYLHEKNIKYTVVPSNTWKSTLKIKGHSRTEQKRNAQKYVLDNYNIKATQDTCDAICIGTHMYTEPEDEGFNWAK